ncbi:MAG TPA: SMI1/KNR4 family protein [Anaerolineae bacterium]|nr:SMI1/KNR4 family protein [Anaerolineae bacterium]
MTAPAIQELFDLLDALGDQVAQSGGVPIEAIDEVESILKLRFPKSYRLFLSRHGTIKVGPVTIYGMSSPTDQEPSLAWALKGLWSISPDLPKNLVPFHPVEDAGVVACLQCQEAEASEHDAPVILWDLNLPLAEQSLEHASPGFANYLHERLSEWKHRQAGLERMEWHVRRFEDEYLNVGKLPRNHVWRPYRFCVQDVVIGLVVVRHSLQNNWLEVDVCLTSDVPEYEPDSGGRMTSAFLLSEAYKCGGTMEIRFSEHAEDGKVPTSLCRLAQKLGVDLNHIADGRITPSEARRFYMALTGFSPALQKRIIALSTERKLSQERACYVVHHGVWTCPEVESIVFGSQRPDSIFGGDTLPERRHLHMQDILHARAAILGGFLDRKLARRERMEGDVAIELEDDTRRLDITLDPTFYAKIYQCDEDLLVPWPRHGDQCQSIVPAGDHLIALVRARDASDFNMHFQQDLEVACELGKSFSERSVPAHIFLLTPRDFEGVPSGVRDPLLATARARGVGIMVCPETVASLDADASRRLASSRILRQ